MKHRAIPTACARARWLPDIPLLLVLLLALGLRVLLWSHVPRAGLISDEGEYLSAASWLVAGHGFDWYQGYLWTRAPLYPLLVAAHLRLFGDSLAPIYATQTILSLVNVVMVYLLAKRMVDDRPPTTDRRPPKGEADRDSQSSMLNAQCSIPILAAGLMAVYFPFAVYTQVLLSETLFIALLLGGFLALAGWAAARPPPAADRSPMTTQDQGPTTKDQEPRNHARRQLWSLAVGRWSSAQPPARWLIAAGVLFGLATLTRSLTLAFLPVVALWLFLRTTTDDRRPTTGPLRPASSVVAGPSSIVHRPSSLVSGLWSLVVGRLRWPALFLLVAALTIAPWTIYSSRLYGGLVVVDTTGAFNLMLGARTAYDGNRNDAATREFVLALLDQSLSPQQRANLLQGRRPDGAQQRDPACLMQHDDPRLLDALRRKVKSISQAERQHLMTAEATCLILARPAAFARKSLAELVDLFQINYGGAERFADGFALGQLPRWYSVGLFLLDDTIYVLALPLAVIGWGLARRTTNNQRRTTNATRIGSLVVGRWSLVSLVGLWWLYNVAVAPLLFAINRFRLPLLPFAFVFAACALVALARGGWRGVRWGYGALAVLLLLVAATPYAYLEPRAPGDDSKWASYLGPYPSSLASTALAWRTRPSYLAELRVRAALGAGDAAEARRLLASTEVTSLTLAIARPLLAGLEGHPDEGLRMLEQHAPLSPVDAAVIRGDLLRRQGDSNAARAVFTQKIVDDSNPVGWAWDWLHPPPLPGSHIDLAGNLDLGYIDGCYLGEGDSSITPPANFRWCTDGARLRFPGAGTGMPQRLALRIDGRGWASFARSAPPVSVIVNGQEVGTFTPDIARPGEASVELPPAPAGSDIVVTLRTRTFVPDAARYLSQQGKSVVGQVQRLGVRIDWAELRESAP